MITKFPVRLWHADATPEGGCRTRRYFRGVLLGFIAFGLVGCGSGKQQVTRSPHVAVTPSSGEGSAQEFSVSVAPADDLKMAGLLMNQKPDGSRACYTLLDVTKPKYFLVKDPGSGSFPFTPESSAENSQCTVRVLYARLNTQKNAFEFRIAADFKPAFAGGQSLFVLATDRAGGDSLQQAGSWMVAP